MWPSFSDSPYVLRPKHAAVFRAAAAWLSEKEGWLPYEDQPDDEGAYDSMPQGAKQAAILTVSKALLDPDFEPPKLAAALEATVDAVYRQLESLIELETIGDIEGNEFRTLVLEAIEEMNYWEHVSSPDEPVEPLTPDNCEFDEWRHLVEALRTEVLEDYDFDMAADIADLPPDQASAVKQQLGIDPDYFVDPVDDPPPERIPEIRRELRALLNQA
jgi:hypothetical protein